MYRRPKFLEVLLDIRREMAEEADYDTDLFAEMVRAGRRRTPAASHSLDYGKKTSAGKKSAKRPKAE